VSQYALGALGVLDQGDQAHAVAAAGALEYVEGERSLHEAGPVGVAAGAGAERGIGTGRVVACYACNCRKGHRSPAQVGMRLLKPPARPQWLPVIAFRVDPSCSVPETWINWIYWHGALEEDSAESRS
jgi:hypothetical protein